MADTLARFGPTQPAASATTLITAGAAGTYTILRNMHAVNTTAAPATLTVGINGVGAANALWFLITLQPYDYLDWTGNIPLAGSATTPDTLQALQGTAAAITVTTGTVIGP